MKKQVLFTFLAMLVSVSAFSHDIEVANADGVTIYYNYINNGTELEVTFRGSSYNIISNEYQGNVVIPEEVTYMNRTRKVTYIGYGAFYQCPSLSSITIPNSVTGIGERAFSGCSGLTSVTIGNSVTSIGNDAFSGCSKLTSITIPNSVTSIGNSAFYQCYSLSSITIPNSVTSIGERAFWGCTGLTSVTLDCSSIGTWFSGRTSIKEITLGEHVTSIENDAFYECSGLTSVTIPNSVTSIGNWAFWNCSGLTSVTIPNSVTSIGSSAFSGCSRLTSIIIPNSVTSIKEYAFYDCFGLTSVTIGSGVTSIGRGAFHGADIPTVVSLIENPFAITGKTSDSRTFTLNTFNNATLYVPKGTIEKYKATEGWKDFLFIEEGDGSGGDTPEPPIPEPQKCATPTITYENGKLKFSCETEGVEFVYNITPPSAKAGKGTDISIPTTYKVTVYATKAGYDDSDVATKEINLGGGGAQDVNGDGIVDTQDVLEIYKYIQEH